MDKNILYMYMFTTSVLYMHLYKLFIYLFIKIEEEDFHICTHNYNNIVFTCTCIISE